MFACIYLFLRAFIHKRFFVKFFQKLFVLLVLFSEYFVSNESVTQEACDATLMR